MPAGTRCVRCNAVLSDARLDLCTPCGTRRRGFDRLGALGDYDGPWADLIGAYKFDREPAVGRWLASRLAEKARREGWDSNLDGVTYVPMTRDERRRRGLNPSRRLARGVARRLGVPICRALRKTRDTRRQASLSRCERRENLQGAFRAIPSVRGHILLVDDIATTGSTADACGWALKEAGCTSVDVLVVARA